jgi:hypothetical protein
MFRRLQHRFNEMEERANEAEDELEDVREQLQVSDRNNYSYIYKLNRRIVNWNTAELQIVTNCSCVMP